MANTQIKRLVGAGVILALIVVSVGAYTRLADAGLGCPDWPGCCGYLTVPESEGDIQVAQALYPDAPVEVYKAWWEMGHRYIAGLLLLLVAGVWVLCIRGRRENTPVVLASVIFGVIICQAAFGAWTVTLKLWPQVVTAHLLGGFTTLSLMWLLLLRQGAFSDVIERLPKPSTLSLIAFIVVVIQIALGGWVSSNYAALACYDFPSCDGSYTPDIDLAQGFNLFQDIGPNYLGGLMDNSARMAIHWVHRLGALVVLVAVGALATRLIAKGSILGYIMAAVLAIQISLGILNVVWVLPLLNATAHNTVGALLLLCVVTVNFAPRLNVVRQS